MSFIYFAVTAITFPTVALSAAPFSFTAGPAIDPIAPPIMEPTVDNLLLPYDSVPPSPDSIPVDTQEQSSIR